MILISISFDYSYGKSLQSLRKNNIYLFKVNNRNTWKRCEICLKLTIKIIDVVLVFLLLTLNIFSWVYNQFNKLLNLGVQFCQQFSPAGGKFQNHLCSPMQSQIIPSHIVTPSRLKKSTYKGRTENVPSLLAVPSQLSNEQPVSLNYYA